MFQYFIILALPLTLCYCFQRNNNIIIISRNTITEQNVALIPSKRNEVENNIQNTKSYQRIECPHWRTAKKLNNDINSKLFSTDSSDLSFTGIYENSKQKIKRIRKRDVLPLTFTSADYQPLNAPQEPLKLKFSLQNYGKRIQNLNSQSDNDGQQPIVYSQERDKYYSTINSNNQREPNYAQITHQESEQQNNFGKIHESSFNYQNQPINYEPITYGDALLNSERHMYEPEYTTHSRNKQDNKPVQQNVNTNQNSYYTHHQHIVPIVYNGQQLNENQQTYEQQQQTPLNEQYYSYGKKLKYIKKKVFRKPNITYNQLNYNNDGNRYAYIPQSNSKLISDSADHYYYPPQQTSHGQSINFDHNSNNTYNQNSNNYYGTRIGKYNSELITGNTDNYNYPPQQTNYQSNIEYDQNFNLDQLNQFTPKYGVNPNYRQISGLRQQKLVSDELQASSATIKKSSDKNNEEVEEIFFNLSL